MNPAPINALVLILKHHGVPTCIVGELALNYYNVPRVCHDVEICVPKSSAQVAPGLLCSTGLFEPVEIDNDLNNFTEYQRSIPRVMTTSWISPAQAVLIFPADFFGLGPIQKALIAPLGNRRTHTSREILALGADSVSSLPFPRLAPFLTGLAQRFLDTRDDMAMIAVEQLVDGMDLDEKWVQEHFEGCSDLVTTLVLQQVRGKQGRIDYFSDNKITCFISNKEEAEIERLNDAAIALHRILSQEHVKFGIFGGYAIRAIGGVRESKDIDCLASVSKDRIIQVLNNKGGFQVIPQSRQDYVAFFWSDKSDRQNAVLVEIFCEKFPGAKYAMGDGLCEPVAIKGHSLGDGTAYFFDPFYLFKGKLRAAATQTKFHDSADLRMLAGKHKAVIKGSADKLSPEYVGLAVKRYPELERLFKDLGVDMTQAKQAAAHLDPDNLPALASGDV
ncbi:hypothetical protein QQX98_009214 [Neonectria punicea]|uniref:Uncharacterized protein n=1 Tax=Neonectria punicea TaxID=979145 RepID=A0ABR1GSZ7_9HYPO